MGRRKRVAEDLPINREEQEEWQPTGPCRFQQLPQALVIDILSRLLVKPLLNCRCVCKSWLSIISDPQFSFVHLPKSPIGILINTKPEKRTSRIIDYTQIEESADSQFHLEKMRFSTKNSLPPLSCFELINSCNGLLLLAEVGPNIDGPFPLYVCNPILGEFIALPLANEGRLYCSFIGLGCSAVTKEYKVLQTCGDYRKDEDGARIYTIGTGVWKSIGKTPQDFAQFAPFNAVLHGALHWLASSGRTLELINAFHFETEEFRTLPPPGSFTPFQKQFKDCLKLGVFDGCLFICVYGYDSSKFDMWVMKEYGVQESWRKTLVVEGLYPRQLDNDVYEPLVFLRNGEILLSYIDWTVVCYNQEKKRLRETRVVRTQSNFRAIGYNPCFFFSP